MIEERVETLIVITCIKSTIGVRFWGSENIKLEDNELESPKLSASNDKFGGFEESLKMWLNADSPSSKLPVFLEGFGIRGLSREGLFAY